MNIIMLTRSDPCWSPAWTPKEHLRNSIIILGNFNCCSLILICCRMIHFKNTNWTSILMNLLCSLLHTRHTSTVFYGCYPSSKKGGHTKGWKKEKGFSNYVTRNQFLVNANKIPTTTIPSILLTSSIQVQSRTLQILFYNRQFSPDNYM